MREILLVDLLVIPMSAQFSGKCLPFLCARDAD